MLHYVSLWGHRQPELGLSWWARFGFQVAVAQALESVRVEARALRSKARAAESGAASPSSQDNIASQPASAAAAAAAAQLRQLVLRGSGTARSNLQREKYTAGRLAQQQLRWDKESLVQVSARLEAADGGAKSGGLVSVSGLVQQRSAAPAFWRPLLDRG